MPPLWLGPFCQISNLAGSPLAHAFRHISGTFYLLPAQPVVHSPKWSTSSQLSPRFRPFFPISCPASGPLFRVDHWLATFTSVPALLPRSLPSQWSTLQSRPLARGFRLSSSTFTPFPTQLVVHSKEWTTGSGILPCISPFPHTKKPLSSGQGRYYLGFWC